MGLGFGNGTLLSRPSRNRGGGTWRGEEFGLGVLDAQGRRAKCIAVLVFTLFHSLFHFFYSHVSTIDSF